MTKSTFIAAAVLGIALGSVVAASAQQQDTAALPMAEYVGFGHNPQIELDIWNVEEASREDFIEKCMQSAGFSYWASPGDAVVEVPDSGNGLASSLRDTPAPLASKAPSQNDLYVDQLSPSERNSYLVALYGQDWESVSQSEAAYAGSCTAMAHDSVKTLARASRELGREYLADVEEQIANQTAVVDETIEWSRCIAEAGYAYERPSDMYAALDEEASTLLTIWGSAIPSDEIDRFEETEGLLLKAHEQCGETLNTASSAARAGLERLFVDAHGADLEPLRLERWTGDS
jgi:hypothetical protein